MYSYLFAGVCVLVCACVRVCMRARVHACVCSVNLPAPSPPCQGGYRKYREMLANTSLPAVPYFGVFLRDLTQIVEYNPDYVRGGLINLVKRRLVGGGLEGRKRGGKERRGLGIVG